MTNRQDEFPPAPKLKQNEFANDDTINRSQVVDEAIAFGDRTPLALVIPKFDSVNMLPTPMTYTPPSSQQRSPLGHSLNVPKRRGEVNLLQRFENGSQLRVVSELPPFADPLQKRISSLPTVSETSSTADVERAAPSFNDTESDDDILTGYLLDDLTTPLKWRRVEEIGSGNFSTVYLYHSLRPVDYKFKQVCVKRIKFPKELLDENVRGQILYTDLLSRLESSLTRELAILKSLNHPCIVKLYGVNNPILIESKKPLRDLMLKNKQLPRCDMIMSYCPGGDLLMAAASCNGNLELWLIQRIFAELVIAVQYLHENFVIHRDLKLENVLLKYSLNEIYNMKDSIDFTHKNIIELADFGLCKKIEAGELCTARCGSEDYVSPEILMGVPYDGRLSDTWALGVILYGLLEDRLPFDAPPNSSSRQRNRATSHRIARYDWKWVRLASEDLKAKEIVENTLTRKSHRWDINKIFLSAFVKNTAISLIFQHRNVQQKKKEIE